MAAAGAAAGTGAAAGGSTEAGAGVFTEADLVASTAVDFTVVDFTVASRVCTEADLAGFMGAGSMRAGSTGIDFAMGGSTAIDFAITDFSSVEGSDILMDGITLPTMAIMTTASPTPRRLGTTVGILQAITLT
jgi:hypothetical protein